MGVWLSGRREKLPKKPYMIRNYNSVIPDILSFTWESVQGHEHWKQLRMYGKTEDLSLYVTCELSQWVRYARL